jgi:hypothetical protein
MLKYVGPAVTMATARPWRITTPKPIAPSRLPSLVASIVIGGCLKRASIRQV